MKLFGQSLDEFRDELRSAPKSKLKEYYNKFASWLNTIAESQISIEEKNELLRKLANSFFNHPDIFGDVKNVYSNHPLLSTLRILIFHHFEDIKITNAIFLKAFTYCLRDKSYSKFHIPIADKLRFWLKSTINRERPIKDPYIPDNSSKIITTVYTGTGRDFFDALSQGKIKGYNLGDMTSLGIYVSPIDKSMNEEERVSRTKRYADRSATLSFDYPIYVELNIPTQYLSHTYYKGLNNYNRYEAEITEQDLGEIRNEKTLGVTVFYYNDFKVEVGRDPHDRRDFNTENLGLTSDQFTMVSEFIKENINKTIHLSDSPISNSRHFIFGESLDEKTKDLRPDEPIANALNKLTRK